MSEHRFTSSSPDHRANQTQLVKLDAAWQLSLNGAPPANKLGRELTLTVEEYDELVIGVAPVSAPLTSVVVVLVDPNGSSHTLSGAHGTDGESVTATAGDGTTKKKINVKVVPEDDLPDPS